MKKVATNDPTRKVRHRVVSRIEPHLAAIRKSLETLLDEAHQLRCAATDVDANDVPKPGAHPALVRFHDARVRRVARQIRSEIDRAEARLAYLAKPVTVG